MQKLTNTKIKNVKPKTKTQKLGDGNGLVLIVKPTGSKLFNFNFRFNGQQRTVSFGAYPTVSLEQARDMVKATKALLKENIDPSIHKKQMALSQLSESQTTFEKVAKDWFDTKSPNFSDGHKKRCKRMLEIHLIPQLGNIPIARLTTQMILKALKKIEAQDKIETAHRAKQVAGQVIRFGIQSGLLNSDVTLHLKGALKTPKSKHFAALTKPDEFGALLKNIEHYQGGLVVQTALKLAPHLFLRPGELRQLEWEEIDFEESIITIPEGKMKLRKAHSVPLSTQVIRLLEKLKPFTGASKYVFPSPRGFSRCISDNAIRTAIRSMGYGNDKVTVHGFRASARTMLDERLKKRKDLIYHQLAHAVKDANGEAYNRAEFIEERAVMMQDWSDYLDELRNSEAEKPSV